MELIQVGGNDGTREMGRPLIIGAPTDRNSSFLRGAASAPSHIRSQFTSGMGNPAAELFAGFEAAGFDDAGDLPLVEAESDDGLISDAIAKACIDGRCPISLGGDHSITYPILQAIHRHHGPVSILQFDAHPDLYDQFLGNRRSHASPFARIMEEGLCRMLVQVGIRTLNDHQREQARRFDVKIVGMRNFSVDRIPLPDGPLYISIDLDALDPAIAPGVSHHEPGGLTVREILDVLERLRNPIVGADVVELNPARDVNAMTAAVAAKLVKELGALAQRNSHARP